MVNFKKIKIEALGNTFNLHSNSTNAQEVWTLNWLQRKNLRVTYTHLHHFTMMFSLIKFCTFFSLYLTNYLIGLTFWAFPIGLKCVAWNGTNKTLAPMGLGLLCQLLTSPKLPLTIFNTTI